MYEQAEFESSEFVATEAALRRLLSKHRTVLFEIKISLETIVDRSRAQALEPLWYRLFFDLPPHIRNVQTVCTF
jgi:hypothetical protein